MERRAPRRLGWLQPLCGYWCVGAIWEDNARRSSQPILPPKKAFSPPCHPFSSFCVFPSATEVLLHCVFHPRPLRRIQRILLMTRAKLVERLRGASRTMALAPPKDPRDKNSVALFITERPGLIKHGTKGHGRVSNALFIESIESSPAGGPFCLMIHLAANEAIHDAVYSGRGCVGRH